MGEPYGYAIARMLRQQLGAHSAADHVIALEDANAALVAERDAYVQEVLDTIHIEAARIGGPDA